MLTELFDISVAADTGWDAAGWRWHGCSDAPAGEAICTWLSPFYEDEQYGLIVEVLLDPDAAQGPVATQLRTLN